MRLGEWGEEIVANTVQHGEPRRDFPGILDEEAWLPGPIVGRRKVHLALLTTESTGQSGCDTVVALLRRTWAERLNRVRVTSR